MKLCLKYILGLSLFAIIFSACHRPETYIVTFDANGGYGTMQQQVFTEDEQQALTRNAFSRDGYTFSGWNGNGVNYIDGQMITITNDMTLYAQWTSNSIPSGGSGGSSSGGGYTPSNGQISGHEYVDLGLPSGTLWATCNVGANIPSGTGYYYAWGETAPKTQYNPDNYLYNDNPVFLPATADAATVNWGGGWRMPTYQEMQELLRCSTTCTKQNDMNGILITGYNGNSIFLPAAGCQTYDGSANWDNLYGRYWTSSCENGHVPGLYFELHNYSSGIEIDDLELDWLTRFYGMSIRPVWTSSRPTITIPTVTTGRYYYNWEFSGDAYDVDRVNIDGSYSEYTGVSTWGFRYGTNSDNLSYNIEIDLDENRGYLSGLAENTIYYYQAYATNSVGTGYGAIKSFTTGITIVLNNASNITSSEANVSAYINNENASTISAKGFLYGTSEYNLSQTIEIDPNNDFSATLTGLTAGTTYYCKAYATNSAGTGYSEVISFTTSSR